MVTEQKVAAEMNMEGDWKGAGEQAIDKEIKIDAKSNIGTALNIDADPSTDAELRDEDKSKAKEERDVETDNVEVEEVKPELKKLICAYCRQDISEPPCDASLAYSRARKICGKCGRDFTRRVARTVTTHINRCLGRPGIGHDQILCEEMAKGDIAEEVWRLAGRDR